MKLVNTISTVKNAIPWSARQRLSMVKHKVRDPFLSRLRENISLFDLGTGKTATLIGGGASINNLASSALPINDVFILNHFWLHKHYSRIESGYHCISDHLFLQHPRILELKTIHNPNITFVTTKRIKRRLKRLIPGARFIELNYSASRPIYISQNPLVHDLTYIMQTGATVAADFALPMINYMNFARLEIMGFDLDYGRDVNNYAYDVQGAIFTNRQYLAEIWPALAYTSIQRWISELEANEVEVKSLTPTRLTIQSS